MRPTAACGRSLDLAQFEPEQLLGVGHRNEHGKLVADVRLRDGEREPGRGWLGTDSSHGVASESSPRREPWEGAQWRRSPGRGDRNKFGNSFAAPRLLPFNADPHGWRRGLLSGAAPQLTCQT